MFSVLPRHIESQVIYNLLATEAVKYRIWYHFGC